MWVLELKEDPVNAIRQGWAQNIAEGCCLFTAGQLFRAFDPLGTHTGMAKGLTAAGLGRLLKQAGFRQALGGSLIRTSTGPHRLWIVRNAESFKDATIEEVKTHYEFFFK